MLSTRYWDSVRVTNRRTDVILTKLDEEGIIPEKIFANANGTKHVSHVLYISMPPPPAPSMVRLWCETAMEQCVTLDLLWRWRWR